MTREFIYTKPFRRAWEAMGLFDGDLKRLEEILPELDFGDFDFDWGVNKIEIEKEEYAAETNEVEKKLCRCPVCGHINEEKAFKYYEDTE